MRATHFRIGSTFVSLLPILWAATAQQVPVATKQDDVGHLTAKPNKEDKLAKMFAGIRADAKIRHWKRIRHRDSLEQQVCTIALTGKFPTYHSTSVFGFCKTANPDIVTPELNKVALFADLHPKFGGGT